MDTKILFITGHRKSGTTMFANLFDGHKDFCVYPSDLTILYAYYPNFIGKNFSFNFKKKRLLHVLKTDLTSVLSEKNLIKKFNLKKMLTLIKNKLTKKNIDRIDLILKLVLKSYLSTIRENFFFKYLVVKETSVDIFANKINQWFKDIKFIQIVRDPRDNYASLKSGYNKHYSKIGESEKKLLASMINRAKLDLKFATINPNIIGKKKYKIVKFENLVKDPKKIIKKICKYLEVKFDNKLLYPSIMDVATKGNSYDGEDFTAQISKLNVGNWEKRINKAETQIIEFFMKHEMQQHNYKISYKNIDYNIISDFYNWTNKEFFFHDSFKK